jgi:hypothetical protein
MCLISDSSTETNVFSVRISTIRFTRPVTDVNTRLKGLNYFKALQTTNTEVPVSIPEHSLGFF